MFELVVVSVLTVGVLIGAPLLGHVAGWWASRSLRVRPGAIREWMPSIPDHLENKGRAEARWERRRRAVERKLMSKFSRGAVGVEAQTLAAELGEDPAVVEGALAHMREEIPVRLRVTRGGKLLHDFEADAIAELKSRRRMALPTRFAIFVLGVFANLGAAWPVILSLLIAVGALVMIAGEATATTVGVIALSAVGILFILNLFGGWLTHVTLTPGLGLTERPRLGAKLEAEVGHDRLQAEQAAGWALWSSDRDSSPSTSTSAGCDFDADLGEGLGAAIVVILLLAVVAACTAALFVFFRGIWRAATGSGMPPLDVSPTQWVRSSQPNDSWENFIPTNDLVLRVIRVLRRLVSHTHPRDSGIIGRVMAKAKAQNGRIAALEIALQEGLDLDEATAVGARLSGRANGNIDVTDDGEIDFVFPVESLTDAPANWDDDMNCEYLDYQSRTDSIVKRRWHDEGKLPVNLPGIAWNHVKGASRLAAGTVLMTLTGVAVVSFVPGVPLVVKVLVDSFLPLLALGTFALAGVLRYVTSSMVELGVRRDIRRMGFLQIRRRLSLENDDVQFDSIVAPILNALGSAWKGLDRALIEKELTGVAVDLDLEPTGEHLQFSIAELAERLEGLARHRAQEPGEVELEFEPNEVIFDSVVEHDRIRALA